MNFNGTISITGTSLTIFAVVNYSSSGAAAVPRIMGLAPNSSTLDWSNINSTYMAKGNNYNINVGRNFSQISSTYTTPQAGSTYVSMIKYDGTKGYANMLVGNSTTTDVSMNSTGSFGINYFTIGSDSTGNDGHGILTGYISEILVYNIALSDADRKRVEGYLSWKWGVQANLPSTHPYYSAAP